MTKRKKTMDPKLVKLYDKAGKARADFEKAYSRMKRSFNRMEKAKRRLASIGRQIDKLENPAPTVTEVTGCA